MKHLGTALLFVADNAHYITIALSTLVSFGLAALYYNVALAIGCTETVSQIMGSAGVIGGAIFAATLKRDAG